MKLYNTYSRKLEILRPLKKNRVRIYTCGPTVYNAAHIGNMRAYIFSDTLVRSLAYLGFSVTHAMNITDVGHLTSDGDEGEDKIDTAAKRERKNPLAIARGYEKKFFSDEEALDIHIPKKIGRATETIGEQIALIALLEKKGYTYTTDHGIYFDVSKFKQYGALSGQKLDQKKTLSREELIEDTGKKHPQDFALWFFIAGKHKNHLLRWPSPWGEGFPGWHLECSSISRKLLGQPFDIHTGGVDHIGVHHENEIAQSMAAYGVPLARVWLHNEHLIVDGIKMSKSLGNAYTLDDIEKNGYDPLAFRYFCLQGHYRSILNFTWEGLGAAQIALGELRTFMATILLAPPKKQQKTGEKYAREFKNAVSDNLNTPKALATVWTMAKDPHVSLTDRQRLLLDFDRVLGLGLSAYRLRGIPAGIRSLIRVREAARRNKQFIQSDTLRNKIKRLGYDIQDSPQGTYVTFIKTPSPRP